MSKIPPHAKKVFQGDVYEIYQWPQQMFDGTVKTFEVAKRLPGVSIIATHQDKIVILHQRQPNTDWHHTLPGGYMDKPGENPLEAAERELLEETGLKSEQIFHWKTYNPGGRLDSDLHFFIAPNCQKIAEQSLDGGEEIVVQFVDFEEFLEFAHHENFHSRSLIIEMLKAKLDPNHKNEFKKLIFKE